MDEREAQRSGYPLTIPAALLNSEAMRRACEARDFREIFRLVNRRTGSSYADMAAAIGKMTNSRISDVIRGVRGIRGQHVIERIADGFGIPGEMLGLPRRPWEGSSQERPSREVAAYSSPQSAAAKFPSSRGEDYLDASVLDEMIRREFLRLMSIANASLVAPEVNMLCETRLPAADSRGFIEDCDRMNSHLWQVFALSSSKNAVYPVVRGQLAGLVDGLKNAADEEQHRRLCGAAGNLFQLAGEIFFDSNHYTEAAHCYTVAASASKEAGAFDLWACALTRHAFVGLYEGAYSTTVHLLETAERIARRGDSQLSTRHWVAAVQAEVFAKVGDYEACSRSLDKAEQVRSLGSGMHNGGWLRFDGSRLAEERGTCFAALDRPDQAEAALTEALKQPLSSRRRGGVLVDLADTGIQQRDVEKILAYAHAAVELAQRTGSGYVGRKLQALQVRLAPLLTDQRILQLNDQISTLRHVG
ncbi:hypothetical protein [Streptomyces specialis]|uniref:hypothetical protein n=1 Tax=Streptomyces specialis TaxID=498367 RepID=UPI000B114276|nr:hypothetical protein [Streptomyces specialis]